MKSLFSLGFSFRGTLSLAFAFLIALVFSGCTIYQSPERKEFESDSPQFKSSNLSRKSCARTSIGKYAQASKLVTIFEVPINDTESNSTTTESHFLWEHIVNKLSYFETTNLKGSFCAYEKK